MMLQKLIFRIKNKIKKMFGLYKLDSLVIRENVINDEPPNVVEQIIENQQKKEKHIEYRIVKTLDFNYGIQLKFKNGDWYFLSEGYDSIEKARHFLTEWIEYKANDYKRKTIVEVCEEFK